ncbi:hypothetical protein N2152v2_002742 [Parachlorella kessleri]
MAPLAALLALALAGLLVPADSGDLQPQALNLGLPDGLYADRQALLALKAIIPSSGFGSSTIKTGWPSSTSSPNYNPCNSSTAAGSGGVLQNGAWPYIICSANRVTQLKLAGLGIVGDGLPVDLAYMDSLNTLLLQNNKFTGTVPDGWAGPALFSSLVTLRLSGNQLSGTLPPWDRRGAFKALSELSLDNNQIEGALPASWAGLSRPLRSVTTLNLAGNNLGQVPDGRGGYTYPPLPNGATDWGSSDLWDGPFPRLKVLNVEGNAYKGPLPSNWGSPYAFGALRSLRLGSNQLSGTLPASWAALGAFPRLQELQLQWNNLGDPAAKGGHGGDRDGRAGGEDTGGGLPEAWKRAGPPRAFPALQTLVLFNGNGQICGQPQASNTKLQGDAAYNVTDAVGRVYVPGGAWRACS